MIIFRVAIFIVGAWLSWGLAIMGLAGIVFGIVVIVWHWSFTRRFYWFRWAGFLLLSTFIFILVIRMQDHAIFKAHKIVDPAILAGTVLIVIAHKFLLKASWLRTVIAISGVYAFTTLDLWFLSVMPKPSHPDLQLFNPVAIWQGTYLMFMFARNDDYYRPMPERDFK